MGAPLEQVLLHPDKHGCGSKVVCDNDAMKVQWHILVTAGKNAVKSRDDAQWVLGDLACEVETSYGEQDLQNFADAIGVEYSTLRRYRDVCRAWPKNARRRAVSFEAHKALAPADAQHLLTDGMTLAEARATRQALEERNNIRVLPLTMVTITAERESKDKPESSTPATSCEASKSKDSASVIIDGEVIAEEWGDGEGEPAPSKKRDDGSMILEAAHELDGATRYAAELLRQWDTTFVNVLEDSWGNERTRELYLTCGRFAVDLKNMIDKAHKPMEVAA